MQKTLICSRTSIQNAYIIRYRENYVTWKKKVKLLIAKSNEASRSMEKNMWVQTISSQASSAVEITVKKS